MVRPFVCGADSSPRSLLLRCVPRCFFSNDIDLSPFRKIYCSVMNILFVMLSMRVKSTHVNHQSSESVRYRTFGPDCTKKRTMKQHKQDRRSQRTYHLVSTAMMALLLEKRYDAITA